MAGHKTHTIVGILVGIAVLTVVSFVGVYNLALPDPRLNSLPGALSLMAIAVFFSLWPDIDTKSVIQKIFYSFLLLIDLGLILAGFHFTAAMLGFFAMLPLIGKHRGWTHSWIASVGIPLPLLLVPMLSARDVVWTGAVPYLSGVLGYCAHLVIDGRLR